MSKSGNTNETIINLGYFRPFLKKSNVLYLGAAEGNTIGFLSEICNEGKIVGEGRHKELLNKCNLYSKLQLQQELNL